MRRIRRNRRTLRRESFLKRKQGIDDWNRSTSLSGTVVRFALVGALIRGTAVIYFTYHLKLSCDFSATLRPR
jgi:hypothetical protein